MSSENAEMPLFPSEKAEDKEIYQERRKEKESGERTANLAPKHCQQIIAFWNKTVDEYSAGLPKVKTLGEDRMKKMRVRWKEFATVGDPVEVTRQIFRNACRSKFFQGDNPRGWSGNFDWIFTNSKNWAKVYEGNYNDKENMTTREEKPEKKRKSYASVEELAKAEGWA